MELIRNIFLEARIASEEERAVVALALEGGGFAEGDGVSNVGNSRISWKRRGEERWMGLGVRNASRTRTDYWATQQERGGKGDGGEGEEKRGDEEARAVEEEEEEGSVERERWRQCSRPGATWHERAGE